MPSIAGESRTAAEAVRLYRDEGRTARQVAAEFGVSDRTVRRWLRDAEVTTRKRGRGARADVETADIIRLREGGLTWQKVAQELHISETAARKRYAAAQAAAAQRPERDPWRSPGVARDLRNPANSMENSPAWRLGDLPAWVLRNTRPDMRTGCMIWCGHLDGDGYGRAGGKLVHREVWAHLVGPIAPGMTLDHVRARGCRSSACWAPWHLEEVTEEENQRRAGRRRRLLGAVTAEPAGVRL